MTFRSLIKSDYKILPKRLQIDLIECPKDWNALMPFTKLIKFKNKISSRGYIWIRLNAPKTKMPVWPSELGWNLMTKLGQQAANGSDWMP